MTWSMQWSIYSHRFIYQWIDLSWVSVQLVSLLQWHRQCNDSLIALSISESIRLPVHMQLVSLLQWHLFSMQWSIFSSFYSSVNLIIHSHATSESATMMSSKLIFSMSKSINESASMTLSMQWSIFSSFYSSVNRFAYSFMCN